ncbi:MAG: UDP-glucose 4-epimerase GalE [Myxococcota bacterium]|nr:UDP-glucose 4-epimerase GalE [Myxococcota bacterium]
MSAKVLVVGGAGYIGSVTAAVLASAGFEVVTFDDLSTGHAEAAVGQLIEGDIRDRDLLTSVLSDGKFDAVMHFAAKSLVGESVAHPLRYYDVNVGGTASLVCAMQNAGVNCLVFSSTCAVYGNPQRLPLDETHPQVPVSPYGASKKMVEEMLAACRERENLRVTTLRYFNAAGCMPDGSLGESHKTETHLIPLAIAAAMGNRPPLSLFGTDYDTRDGTCIRDYIHVLDLADAHVKALRRLLAGDPGDAYNVGTGVGTTVREVLAAIGRSLGTEVPHAIAERRPGDPPALFAAADKIRRDLEWVPQWTDIDSIVDTAVKWAKAPRY